MRDETAVIREALFAIRAQLDQRGLHMKVLASKAGVSPSTFLSWFPVPGGAKEPQVPSLSALPGLAKALPADLLSYLVPDGFHIVPDPEGVDYDEFADGCHAYLARKSKAHCPDSPAGRELSDCEKADLDHLRLVGGAK